MDINYQKIPFAIKIIIIFKYSWLEKNPKKQISSLWSKMKMFFLIVGNHKTDWHFAIENEKHNYLHILLRYRWSQLGRK